METKEESELAEYLEKNCIANNYYFFNLDESYDYCYSKLAILFNKTLKCIFCNESNRKELKSLEDSRIIICDNCSHKHTDKDF